MSNFSKKKQKVQNSYDLRKMQEAEVWQGFDDEVISLTSLVREEFRKVLDELGLVVSNCFSHYSADKAVVVDYSVSYNPLYGNFKIKINKIASLGGKDTSCPHVFLDPITGYVSDEINPRIKQFKQDYLVDIIENPNNNCEHK